MEVCLALATLITGCSSAIGQNQSSGRIYTNGVLAMKYRPPEGLLDKTERFRLEIREQAKTQGTTKTLKALLAMSSGSDDRDPRWGSITIETYPRSEVLEPDDVKAAAKMNAWVAHSKDASALPKAAVISGQSFTVSVFGLQEGTVKKGAVVFTTIRKGKLLSFAFAANSPERLKELTETMKSVQFY